MPSETVDRILRLLRNVKARGNGWTALCQAHDDKTNSLSIHEGHDGRVLLHCFAGCETSQVVGALGLQMRDLFAAQHEPQPGRGEFKRGGCSLTIKSLASDKGLPSDFLLKLGLRDRSDGVLVPYRMMDGTPAPRQRLRTALKACDGSSWLAGNGSPVPYGLWRLGEAEKAGHLTLVEGESDCWTAWIYGMPALGIPGASMTHTLEAIHLKNIGWMYVVKEPDRGGEAFVSGVIKRCSELHWQGLLFILTLPPGVKDLNDLHKQAPAQFRVTFEAALAEAAPVEPQPEKSSGEDSPEDEEATEKSTQAESLIELVKDVELFHNADAEGYAALPFDTHRETWGVRERAVRRFLIRRFYQSEGKPPSSQALQSTLDLLEARAAFDGAERKVFVRLAEHEGAIYLDLANSQWEAVEISGSGWRVVPLPPIKFRRTRGMAALPYPAAGGSVDELGPFINVASEEDFRLLVCWLIAALRPKGPYPVLALHGEHGTAKSFAARVLRSLVDPNRAPLRAEPSDLRDLMISASKAWCLTLDNLSHLQPWLSDAICRLATGGGFSTRQLYLDDEEMIFEAQRPVVINGIEELATRGDLLDRCLVLHLPEIAETQRRDEEELWFEFERTRPRILGALLDAVSAALRTLPEISLPKKPRMADFAVWATAAESGLGWKAGVFLKAYAGNRNSANEVVLEASPVAGPLQEAQPFEGTSSELLKLLNERADDSSRKQQGWPKSARALSGALKRIAPNLRAAGLKVEFRREPTPKRRRLIIVRKAGDSSVRTVQSVQSPEISEGLVDGADANGPECGRNGIGGSHVPNPQLDGVDGLDEEIPPSCDEVR